MIPTTQESQRASLTPPTTPLHVLRPSRSTPTLRISLDDARPHPKPPLSAYPSPPSFRPSAPRIHDELTPTPTEYFVQEHMSHFPHLHSARDTLHEVYPHEGPRTSTPTRSTFRTTSYNHMALEVTPPPESFAHPRPKTPDTISSRASQISLPGSTDSFSYIFWKAPQPGVDAPEDTPRGPSPQHFLDPMEIPGQNGPRPYARTRVVSSPAVPSRTHSQIPSPSHTIYGSHKNTSNPDISLFDPALHSPKRTLFNTYPAFPLTPPRSEADPVSFYTSPAKARASPISFAGIRRWLPLLDDHDSDPLNNVDVERDADEKHRVQRQRVFERNPNYSQYAGIPSSPSSPSFVDGIGRHSEDDPFSSHRSSSHPSFYSSPSTAQPIPASPITTMSFMSGSAGFDSRHNSGQDHYRSLSMDYDGEMQDPDSSFTLASVPYRAIRKGKGPGHPSGLKRRTLSVIDGSPKSSNKGSSSPKGSAITTAVDIAANAASGSIETHTQMTKERVKEKEKESHSKKSRSITNRASSMLGSLLGDSVTSFSTNGSTSGQAKAKGNLAEEEFMSRSDTPDSFDIRALERSFESARSLSDATPSFTGLSDKHQSAEEEDDTIVIKGQTSTKRVGRVSITSPRELILPRVVKARSGLPFPMNSPPPSIVFPKSLHPPQSPPLASNLPGVVKLSTGVQIQKRVRIITPTSPSFSFPRHRHNRSSSQAVQVVTPDANLSMYPLASPTLNAYTMASESSSALLHPRRAPRPPIPSLECPHSLSIINIDKVLPAQLFFVLGFALGPFTWLVGGWLLSPDGYVHAVDRDGAVTHPSRLAKNRDMRSMSSSASLVSRKGPESAGLTSLASPTTPTLRSSSSAALDREDNVLWANIAATSSSSRTSRFTIPLSSDNPCAWVLRCRIAAVLSGIFILAAVIISLVYCAIGSK